MQTFKRWRIRVVLMIAFGLVCVLGVQSRVRAFDTVDLGPTDDTFVDLNNPALNYDPGPGTAGQLEISYSNFVDFVAVRSTLIQFDVASVPASTRQLTLRLTVARNGLPPGSAVVLGLWETQDSWSERTVTHAAAPPRINVLQEVSIPAGQIGEITFNAVEVGAYLERERVGDQVASFLLAATSTTGDGANLAGSILFYDRAAGDAGGPAIVHRLEPLPAMAEYGNIPGSDTSHINQVDFSFDGHAGDVTISFEAYDIDSDDEVEVLVNDELVANVPVNPAAAIRETPEGIDIADEDKVWTGPYTLTLSDSLVVDDSRNILTFDNTRNPPNTWWWGVRNVQLVAGGNSEHGTIFLPLIHGE